MTRSPLPSPPPAVRAGALYRAARRGEAVSVDRADHALLAACDAIGLVPGEGATAVVAETLPDRPLRIALAGFGIVGQALARRLADEPGFEIAAILVRDAGREREVTAPAPLIASPDGLLAADPDILVDALCCDDTGAFLAAAALSRGIAVASASKRVVAAHHGRLTAAAATRGVPYLYSAAVGGGAPVIETIDRARAAGPIAALVATLNGTVNFILDRMAAGDPFDQALEAAQRAGFAEADPSADLSGADAAAKLRIAACHAFGVEPGAVEVALTPLDAARIAAIAADGRRHVQVARLLAGPGGVEATVAIAPLAGLDGLEAGPAEWNAAAVTLADGRRFTARGRGAGGAPTAEAIVADLFDIAAALARIEAPRAAAC